MNADMLGMHEYLITDMKNHSVKGTIVDNNGYELTDKEVRAYVRYCVKNGFQKLYDCPNFSEVKDKLNL
jgi:uncharacterized protein YehS (DUF1456 family)